MARKSRKTPQPAAEEFICQPCIAAGYVRLSSDDRRKKGDSIATQKNIISHFITMNPDIKLYDFYVDNDETGTNFERPAFQKMLADLEGGKINCVIVKDLSRFGRNAIDTGYYIEKYLPSLNVRFISINDSFDTDDGDGGIIIPLKAVIAEAYAVDIGNKVRSVHRQNIAEGRFVGGRSPYGYLKAPDDCHKLVIDPETAPVVRQIFEWAAQGVRPYKITHRLNDAHILPPSRYKFEKGIIVSESIKGCDYWKPATITEILRDKVYQGDMVQGKTRKVNHRRVEVAPDEWITVENTHEPIVSHELFESVRVMLAQMSEYIKNPSVPYTPNIFMGKVFCGHCGFVMHRHRNKYACSCLWNVTTIQTILADEQYTGTYVAGKTEVKDTITHKQTPKPESEWIKISNNHPSIVSIDTFKRVQELIAQRRKNYNPVRKPRNYALKGKAICACCGHVLNRSHTPNAVFACRFTKPDPKAECFGLKVSENELESAVFAAVTKRAREILSANGQLENKADYAVLLEQAQEKKTRLYEQFKRKEIYRHTFHTLKNGFDMEISKLIQTRIAVATETGSMTMREAAKRIIAEKHLTKETADALIDKVRVHPRGNIEIEWKTDKSKDVGVA